MRFAFWPGPGNSWADTLELARHAEATGWDGIWYADHFMPNTPEASGPTSECWTTLTAIGALVPRIRIGALVAGNTYRHPAILANMAANIDIISGGRLVLGLGAGWQENEHEKYGIPLFQMKERMDRYEEACAIVSGLLREERTTFEGKYYQVTDAPCDPKPVQQPLPLLIGGGGEKRTLRIAAKYAQEWNVWGTPDVLKHKMGVLDQRCAEIGRDPKTIQRSAQSLLFLSDDPSARERNGQGGRTIAGNVDQVAETMREYRDAGVNEFIVPDFTLGRDVAAKKAVMDRFINEVAPQVR
jgi:F420-dependent oxidoreductase-like protein